MKKFFARKMPQSLNNWRDYIRSNYDEKLELSESPGSVLLTHDPDCERLHVFINYDLNIVFAVENLILDRLSSYKADLKSFYTDPDWPDHLGEDIVL